MLTAERELRAAIFLRSQVDFLSNLFMRCSNLFVVAFMTGLQISCAAIREFQETKESFNSEYAKIVKSALATATPQQVVGGQEVAATDPVSKLAVLLFIARDEKSSVCTGVVIQPNIILTAAHCVYKTKPDSVRAVFAKELRAKEIVIHENYDGTQKSESDIALVKLAGSVPADYQPVVLIDDGGKATDDEALFIGFGITDENRKDAMKLRKITKSVKQDLHMKGKTIGVEQRSGKGGFCRGDSGAPIFVNQQKTKVLLGINSVNVGLENGKECHTASVAISVAHFQRWIREKSLKM